MKQAQLLSIVFSLIMLTGITAGSAVAYADSDDDYDMDDLEDKLEYFCELSEDEKTQLYSEYTDLENYKTQLEEFCELDEDEREEKIELFIAEHFPEYAESEDEYKRDDDYEHETNDDDYEKDDDYEHEKDHDYERDYDLEDILEKYCSMTDEEKAAYLEEHDKSEEHQVKMQEYCSLDESEREAFIEEHEDEYEKKDYKKYDHNPREMMDKFCEMTEEEQAAHLEEYDKSDHMEKMQEYCSLDDEGRDAFIEEHKDSMMDKRSEHKDSMMDKRSEHKDSMEEKISEHKDSMKSDSKKKMILKASALSVEQKDSIKVMHAELRDLKQSLRDKSISDTDKEDLRDQFMELAKEFSLTWLSPRHQVSAGIDAQEVECREGFELVMKTSNASPMCVKETTADKLVKRGIAILAS